MFYVRVKRTISTVGYGDYNCKTLMGKLFVILVIMCGFVSFLKIDKLELIFNL